MLTIAVAVAVILLDQIGKWRVENFLQEGESVSVIGDWFHLTLVYNQGGAFGLFPHHPYLFILLTLFIIAALLILQRRLSLEGRLCRFSTGLILGGAGGNLIDRLQHNYVIDFLDFNFFNIQIAPRRIGYFNFPGVFLDRWPSFNLADSAICFGVALLIGWGFWHKTRN